MLGLYGKNDYIKELRVRKISGKILTREDREITIQAFKEFLKKGFSGEIQVSPTEMPPDWFYVKVKEEQVIFSQAHRFSERDLIRRIKGSISDGTVVQLVTIRYFGG